MSRQSICLVVPERTSACAYYRAVLPHRHCAPILAERGIDLILSDKTSEVGEHDAYVFYRSLGNTLFPMVTHLWMCQKPIYWDHDDNFRDIPEWNPAFKHFDAPYRSMLDQCNHIADAFSVTTEPLAEVMREIGKGKPVTVLPNLVDCDDFPVPSLRNDGKVRILWAGSGFHEADLKVILPALKAVKAEFGPKVEIVFAGYCPDFVRDEIKPTMFSWWPVESHGRCLSLIGADIGLCPLSDAPEDLPFNRCKSPVKWMEYVAAGAFPLMSEDGPYQSVCQQNGMTIRSDEWERWLGTLVSNRLTPNDYFTGHVKNVRNRGRENVKNCHSWQSEAKRTLWVEWFASMVG